MILQLLFLTITLTGTLTTHSEARKAGGKCGPKEKNEERKRRRRRIGGKGPARKSAFLPTVVPTIQPTEQGGLQLGYSEPHRHRAFLSSHVPEPMQVFGLSSLVPLGICQSPRHGEPTEGGKAAVGELPRCGMMVIG